MQRFNGSPGALPHVQIRGSRCRSPRAIIQKSGFDMCRTDSSFEISVASSYTLLTSYISTYTDLNLRVCFDFTLRKKHKELLLNSALTDQVLEMQTTSAAPNVVRQATFICTIRSSERIFGINQISNKNNSKTQQILNHDKLLPCET